MKTEEKYYIFGILLLVTLGIIIWLCGCSFGFKEIRTKDYEEEDVYCDVTPDVVYIK
jgi:hypothetical protein